MKFTWLALFFCLCSFGFGVTPQIDMPDGWRLRGGIIYDGPQGSFAVIGPFDAPTVEEGISLRKKKLGKTLRELSREPFTLDSGLKGIRVLFEVEHRDQTYLSPQYFFHLGENGKNGDKGKKAFFCVQTIPASDQYEKNHRFIENEVKKIKFISGD
ncbi:MAG: hypothetical protein AAFY98_03285 [Verrucomicrobiota bacterium]